MINQLKVMGYSNKTINLLTNKEKQTLNIEMAVITIANRIKGEQWKRQH